VSHYTKAAEALFVHDDNTRVLFVSGELRLRLNGRIPSQIIHRENACVNLRRSTDLVLIVALSKHRGDFFVDIANGNIPISWTCPSLEAGDCVAFDGNACAYFSGSVRGIDDEKSLIVSTIVLHFKVLPVNPDLTAFVGANHPPEVEIPELTLIFNLSQPPVLRCVCCEYPITNRVSLKSCRRCYLHPPTVFQNIRRFGDLSYVICDMCSTLPVDRISLEAITAAFSGDPTNALLHFMYDSSVDGSTTAQMTCKHAITERESLDPSISALLYYSVQELLESCAWLMRVLLTNVLVINTLIESCHDLVSFANVAGGVCPRASSLAALVLHVVGIRVFSKPISDSISLLQPEMDRTYIKMTLMRLSGVAELVKGLRLASPDVATFSTGLFELMGTASVAGIQIVTACDTTCDGRTHSGFVQCWPKCSQFQANSVDLFYGLFLKLNSKVHISTQLIYESFQKK
jgi:hypothetical protein